MKVEKKVAQPCVIELTVTADAEEIKADYKRVETMFLREGVIPGFRKGKAPLALVQQKFQAEITQEATQACIRALYPKALEEAKLDVLELQGVSRAELSPATGLVFTLVVEVKPEFDLPKYKKLAIKPGDATVSDAQVGDRVEGMRRAFAKYEDAKDGESIAEGDFVQIDYKGTLAKQPLIEVLPDQKAICEATGFWCQVEEGRFLPEVLEALKGMKAGETKTGIKVKFPKDAAPDPIKGKTVTYDVTVKSFRCRQLPEDPAFLEAAKAESMDALRKQIREGMEKEAVAAELEGRRNQAIELLLKKADFGVPPVLVRQQTQNFLQDLARRAQYSGMPADYFEKNRDQILADAENHAVRQVRLSYILAGIAEAEKFEITEADVDAGLEKIAAGSREKITGAELKQRLTDNGQLDGYIDQLKAERALDFVLAEAK